MHRRRTAWKKGIRLTRGTPLFINNFFHFYEVPFQHHDLKPVLWYYMMARRKAFAKKIDKTSEWPGSCWETYLRADRPKNYFHFHGNHLISFFSAQWGARWFTAARFSTALTARVLRKPPFPHKVNKRLIKKISTKLVYVGIVNKELNFIIPGIAYDFDVINSRLRIIIFFTVKPISRADGLLLSLSLESCSSFSPMYSFYYT